MIQSRFIRSLLFFSLIGCGVAAAAPAPAGAMTLEEALNRAMRLSETVGLSDAEVAKADQRRYGTWAIMGPKLSVTGTSQVQGNTSPGPSGLTDVNGNPVPSVHSTSSLALSATLSQPIFRKNFFDSRAAEIADQAQARATAQRTREQLRFDVVTAFITILKARYGVQIAEGNLTRAETQLKSAQARFAGGAALKTFVIQAQIDVYRAERALVNSRAAVESEAATFYRLVGVLPGLLTPPTPVIPPALAEALDRLKRRADIQSARTVVLQNQHLVGAAKDALWPLLDGQLSLANAADHDQDMFANMTGIPAFFGTALGWSAGATLTVPIIQSGSEYVAIRLAKLEVLSAELRVRLLEKTAREDLEHAQAEYDRLVKFVAKTQLMVEEARENYAIVQKQFKAGTATPIDIVISQSTLSDAESDLASASYDRDLAAYRFLFTAGIL